MPGWGIVIRSNTFSPKLKTAPARLKANVAAEMEDVGVEMEAYAKSLCPVRTGYLRSTIFHSVSKDLYLSVGAGADYAVWVEFGTARMPARPFIRPTYDRFLTILMTRILDGVLKVFE